ncbi:YbhB/YbcL family Raf kinase inhibitor-like protein [Methanoplanus sp. FWC-SCC4]|uniref:YbhB/YbcL family Raf kinase inhibitor-like protein n=1 Tax=Methanochimaera problematica TaxID=2609417 RepID=A0AA97FC51_9EURY|nr:YbhB/YbcL family Raf kinase inhibitor-like protein [Methanoplanus sp. FWC-SCC4]WOF16239.1 YbhB/YbcL family Raf kinase inhibitor-like protein [Methanoplanus sp. FWC-SCC4]
MQKEIQKLSVSISVLKLPYNYTCDGNDISPEISIGGVSKDVKSMAAIMLDQTSPKGGNFVHWIMWNIDPAIMIPEDIPKKEVIDFPFNAVQGTNGFGKIGYNGPCPKPGENHRYLLKIYGLDTLLDLKPGSNYTDLQNAIHNHEVAYGETFVLYGR